MKKIIAVAIACLFSATSFCQTTISIDSVSAHAGDSVTVCSKVYGVKSLEKITFINLGAEYPNSPLTVVIHAEDMANFSQPVEIMYSDKNVCVTGTIKEYKGRYEIEVSNPRQIVIKQ
jgi:aspartyl/asparaginyl-tRNA synthetase